MRPRSPPSGHSCHLAALQREAINVKIFRCDPYFPAAPKTELDRARLKQMMRSGKNYSVTLPSAATQIRSWNLFTCVFTAKVDLLRVLGLCANLGSRLRLVMNSGRFLCTLPSRLLGSSTNSASCRTLIFVALRKREFTTTQTTRRRHRRSKFP
jgi:hypothetical protein